MADEVSDVAPGPSVRERLAPTLAKVANAGRPVSPPLPRADGRPRPARRLEIFATGTDSFQITWSALGPGAIRFRVADIDVEVHADGGPGGVRLGPLPGGRRLAVRVDGPGVPDGRHTLTASTLVPPPGPELFRLATVNDVHIGQTSSGFFHTLVEIPEPVEAHPVRCLRAALIDAIDFGARRLLVKGDLTHASTDEHWGQVGELLAELPAIDGEPIPVDVVPGNHEGSRHGTVDPAEGLAALGHHLVRAVEHVDLPGLRLILADSTIAGSDWGTYATPGKEILAAAADATTPVLVGLHHQPMRFPVPTYIPPGVRGPEASAFLTDLGAVRPASMVTTGHTHRHRCHRYGPVVVTEIGSTKDFPGVWASYQIYETGIVQTVHRITEPSCIRWTDHTRRAAAGLWQLWSPGLRTSRCFTHVWPR